MKIINKTKAFTLLEILLVIALAIGIFAISAPLGLRMYRTQLVEDTTGNIIDALERARHYAILQKYDSSFGVTLSEVSDSYVLFAGPDYANRDQTKDEVYPVISQITFSGLTDIVFSSLAGASSTTGTIIISYGDDIVREILIDNSGLIYKRTPPWWELDDSLVGFWTSVKSGSISALGTWLDYSGNDNDGLLAGNAYVDSDGLQLDGSGDYANVGNNSDLNIDSNFTISTWFSTSASPVCQYFVAKKGIGAHSSNWWSLGLCLNKIELSADDNSVKVLLTSDEIYNDGYWHQVIVTRDLSGYKLFLDGEFKKSNNNNGSIENNYDVFIGGDYYVAPWFFDGSINDVMIFSRALSATEITEIYDGQKAKYGL